VKGWRRAFALAAAGLCLASCSTEAVVALATAAPLLTQGTVELIVYGTPAPTPTPTPLVQMYRVKAGDTLEAIARWFAVPPSVLVEANRLSDPDRLTPGELLAIPEVDSPWIPTATPLPTSAPTATPTIDPVPAGVGCFFFANYSDRPFTVTYTNQDEGWSRTTRLPAGARRYRYCLKPGRYTITASAPGMESINTDCVVVAGDRREWPLYLR